MKLHLTQADGRHLITGYGPGWVRINETRHTASLILTPDRVLAGWPVDSLEALTATALQSVFDLAPEILLLGTGERQRLPAAEFLRLLAESGTGFEIMGTAAACRTYNILMAEGRRVAAALIL